MLKVKINNEWIENVGMVEKESFKNNWFVYDLEGLVIADGKIQDIKWVEDEQEEIELMSRVDWCEEKNDGVRMSMLFDQLNTITKAVNKLLEENKQ
jgi:hypothetical protein